MIRKTLPIPSGTSQIEFDNEYQGKLPDVANFAIVSDMEVSGGYRKTGLAVKILGQSTFAFRLMGSKYTDWLNSSTFPNRDYVRNYFAVPEGLCFEIGQNCWDLTHEEWENGYYIYAFKLSPGPFGTVRSPAHLCAARL